MKKMVKHALALVLALVMSLSLCLPGLAADTNPATDKADALNVLGLFKGTDKGYELDKGMTRLEAAIMTIRLTGNEWTALYGQWEHPFTDVPAWEGAEAYAGYAYANGLVTGVAPGRLDPNGSASARMFMTLLLRALGYTDGEKTVWDNWEKLAEEAGLPVPDNSGTFLRGQMVELCWAALDAQVQGTDKNLAQTLLSDGTVSELSLAIARALAGKTVTADSSLTEIAGAVYAGVSGTVTPSMLGIFELDGENMTSFLGTDELKIQEGIAIEPMLSARAHSVCLVRLKPGQDVEKAMEKILNNVDPRKWICVGVDPENIRIGHIGSLICLVMDNGAPDGLMDNFLALEKAAPDANGLLCAEGIYMEEAKTFNADYVRRFARKLVSVREEYIPHNDVYYAVIPDKSYYARDKVTVWADHEAIAAELAANLPGWNAVDLTDTLSLTSYYSTDPHWRQEKLTGVVDALSAAMGFDWDRNFFFLRERAGFVGSYGRKAPDLAAEKLCWLVSDAAEKAVVDNIQKPEVTTVYDEAALSTQNPYDFFLSGATPLQVITNPDAKTDRELVLFRDSYGSALAPLLAGSYAKITLVDLRYMASSLLPQYVSFENADVLFLYSDALVNNLLLLK